MQDLAIFYLEIWNFHLFLVLVSKTFGFSEFSTIFNLFCCNVAYSSIFFLEFWDIKIFYDFKILISSKGSKFNQTKYKNHNQIKNSFFKITSHVLVENQIPRKNPKFYCLYRIYDRKIKSTKNHVSVFLIMFFYFIYRSTLFSSHKVKQSTRP